jgi:cell division protein FtsB
MNFMKRPTFSWKYAIAIVAVVVLASMVINFNNRIAELRRLTIQKELVSARLEGLEKTQASLQTQIAYATSEAAVVDWAYQEGSMVRQGDVPVVPQGSQGSTPVPTPTLVVQRPMIKPWEMWAWLFIDPGTP